MQPCSGQVGANLPSAFGPFLVSNAQGYQAAAPSPSPSRSRAEAVVALLVRGPIKSQDFLVTLLVLAKLAICLTRKGETCSDWGQLPVPRPRMSPGRVFHWAASTGSFGLV